jgi:hypothetical protein
MNKIEKMKQAKSSNKKEVDRLSDQGHGHGHDGAKGDRKHKE